MILVEQEYGKYLLRPKIEMNVDVEYLLDKCYYEITGPFGFLARHPYETDDLWKWFIEDIGIIWREHALCEDNELTEDAKKLKYQLLESFEEITL